MNKVARLLQAQTPSAIAKRNKALFKSAARKINWEYVKAGLDNPDSFDPRLVTAYQNTLKAHGIEAGQVNQIMGKGGYWGRRIGSYLGGLTGNSRMKGWAADLGDQMGDVVGAAIPYGNQLAGMAQHLSGNGDYQIGPQVATFSHNDVQRVKHVSREYLGAIAGSDFSQLSLRINAGDTQTFPRLSKIAAHYDQYQVNSLVFWYHSTSGESTLSANTNIGEVVTCDLPDSTMMIPTTKSEMLETPGSKTAKPSLDLAHGIECKEVPVLFIRHGDANETNARDYDVGRFVLAVDGANAASTRIGELWVTYDIDLLRSRDSKGQEVGAFRADMKSQVPQTDLFTGSASGVSIRANTLPITLLSGNRIMFPQFTNDGDYQIILIFAGVPADQGFTVKAPLITSIDQGSILLNGAETFNNDSGAGLTLAVNRAVYAVRVNAPGAAQCIVTWASTAQWSPFATYGNFGITITRVPKGFFDA